MKQAIRWFLMIWLLPGLAQAGAIRNLAGFTSTVYGPNDDGTYPCTGPYDGIPPGTPQLVSIGFAVNFYGSAFSSLYLNNNGNITFDEPLGEFTPFGLVGTSSQIIAPFFADVDTRAGNLVTFGNDTVDGHTAFGVNWIDVGYYDENTDKLNSFQLVLIDRSDRNPGDFDIEFNYDQVQWETGDASGGLDGFGGSSAVAGFSNGSGLPGTSLQLNGSGIPGSFLDLNPNGLIHGCLNTNVLGRYIFPIVNLTNLVLNVPLFTQGDSRWAGNAYAGSSATIQQEGSALSALAMALNYAGVATDPGALNSLLVQSNDFVGNDVNWDPATRDASSRALLFHAYRTSDAQFLSQSLANGFPLIVGVSPNADGSPTHFVLVVGESNGHFVINDPGPADAADLDYYNNLFETRGYVSAQPANPGGLDISVGNAAEMLVVDPLGRQTGYDPASGTVRNGIPQSAYFADCPQNNDVTGAPGKITAHFVQLYQPLPGNYQILLFGKSAGNYQLSLRSYLQDGTKGTSPSVQGSNAPGTITPYQVNLSSSGATLEPFTNQYPWSASPTSGPWPLSVQFTAPAEDSAGNTITNWYWTFGDGSISTGQNPTHTYLSAAGTFSPSVIAVSDAGATLAFGPSIVVNRSSLVLNGGFELGTNDPTGWETSEDAFLDNGSASGISPHSGSYLAALTTYGIPGYLSQILPTTPGANYLLSFWLAGDGTTPNDFSVSWNGTTVFDQSDIGAMGWTNIEFMVTASSTHTSLEFDFQDDYGYLGLDDVSVAPQTTISGINLAGRNLVVSGGNGYAGGACITFTSTNLTLDLSQWTPVATNTLDTDGTFTFTATNAVTAKSPRQFYLLQMQ
ncbi:MAG: nidogen-like domain-containing protein [Verrucomicrobiota bacterium]